MQDYSQAFFGPLNTTLHRVVSFVPRLLVALALFLLFYGIAVLARSIARKSIARVPHVPWAARILFARSIYLVTLLIGIIVALSAADVNVTTVLTSLGVAGFALGFAFKDILENFISGILLLFGRPFEVEDQVTLGAFEGTVVDIQIRTTTLRTYGDDTVFIPNSMVFTNPVVNHTRLGKRRYMVAFDTSLKADHAAVERGILAVLSDNPEVADDPQPFVRMSGFDSGNDVLHWQAYYWASGVKVSEIKTMSDTFNGIKRQLYDAGVPTPTSTSATILKGEAADTIVRSANKQPPEGPESLGD